MNHKTYLQNTHFCCNLLKIINKIAMSSKIARYFIYETNNSEPKLKKKLHKTALKMNEGHVADLEVIVY